VTAAALGPPLLFSVHAGPVTMSNPSQSVASAAPHPAAVAAVVARLRADVQGFLDEAGAVTGREVTPRRAAALVVPYDPHPLAGPTAGVGFASVEVPAHCIVVTAAADDSASPSSAVVGPARGTPLGAPRGDDELATAIVRGSDGAVGRAAAPAADEALDVLLPFVQVRNPETHVLALRLSGEGWDSARRVAAALAAAIGARDDVLVVAASNMSRDAASDARKDRDARVLEHLLALEGSQLLEVTSGERTFITGAAAMACVCEYARLRGTGAGELVAYSHSGIVTGNADRVTGYAAVVLGAE
jgi:AmmeMemoRadiSam system protein B